MTDMTDTHCQLSVCVRWHRDVSRLAGSAGLAGGGWADIANLAGSGGVLVPASSQPTTHHTPHTTHHTPARDHKEAGASWCWWSTQPSVQGPCVSVVFIYYASILMPVLSSVLMPVLSSVWVPDLSSVLPKHCPTTVLSSFLSTAL